MYFSLDQSGEPADTGRYDRLDDGLGWTVSLAHKREVRGRSEMKPFRFIPFPDVLSYSAHWLLSQEI